MPLWSPAGAVLATLDGARHVRLDTLSEAEALELVGTLVGQERIRRQPAAARRLVRCCGRLALALRIAGARLAARPARPLTALVNRLADARRRLDELRHADLELRSSLSISVAGLDGKARQMFERLGLVDVDQTTPLLAAAISQSAVDEAQSGLEELADAQLVESCKASGTRCTTSYACTHANKRTPRYRKPNEHRWFTVARTTISAPPGTPYGNW